MGHTPIHGRRCVCRIDRRPAAAGRPFPRLEGRCGHTKNDIEIATGKKLHAAASTPVTITHPSRIVFPEVQLTKADVAAYYQRIAMRMTPHLEQRPVSNLRPPDGVGGETFFQRHPMSAAVSRAFPLPISNAPNTSR